MKHSPARQRTALLALLLAVAAPATALAQQTNVVLISADDLGWGSLGGPYGNPNARFPELDALMARGLVLTDYYGQPLCTPSRVSLMTSRYPMRFGSGLIDAIGPGETAVGLPDSVYTLADAFKARGYETAMFGKWHLGHGNMLSGATDTEFHPLYHGFDYFLGSLYGNIDYNNHKIDGLLDWWEGRVLRPEDDNRYTTQVLGDRLSAFIAARPGAGTTSAPFFVYAAFNTPHAAPPGSYPSDWKRCQLPPGQAQTYLDFFRFTGWGETDVRRRHLAMVRVLDDEIGQVVDALETAGLMGNTIIWFVSDNGGEPRFGGRNTPWRGAKASAYEGGIRVPSFVIWDGHIAPGVSAQITGAVDVLPTLLALTGGGPYTRPSDGLSVAGHVLGGPVVSRPMAVPNSDEGDAVRLRRTTTWDWKLVRRYRDNGQPYAAELYNLVSDPAEATNRANAYPDTVSMLMALLPYSLPQGDAAFGPRIVAPVPGNLFASPPTVSVSPNPFSGQAAIRLTLAEASTLRLSIYDMLGREVAVLVDGAVEAGPHEAPFDGSRLPAGTYLVRLEAGGEVQMQRVTRVR
jgi:arylsulfatase A-like enzyme